ncbi:hypothetical protein JZ751_013276 [Albula glossodonta]|uniref:PH domain-containing protein n=1 Tax=Albula glossodonta TaxID=121402 RepID=A0A8T2NUK0_9TELE|nr:hypothetical protein JZ751_013276 [Albula glossodonta]
MANHDRNKKILLELVKQPDNNRCADCGAPVLREQWIRAKYERQEFNKEGMHLQQVYSSGLYEGTLWKKGKDNSHYLKRRFVLSERDFTLRYFTSDAPSKGPKAVIAVKTLNAIFQPEKMGHMHGLQLTYQQEDHTRNLFVHHESGQEIVNWFNAIRATRFAYLKTAFPTASDSELFPWITRNYLKEGFMEKTGPLQRESFKKRWFVLDAQERKLLYFKTQLGTRGNKWKCGVIVETPERQFVFMCEQEREQKEWVDAFRQVMLRPMLPQDFTTEAKLRR